MQSSAPQTVKLPQLNAGIQATLLGIGVGIPTTVGITLKQFLCDHLMISPEYLEDRIQTILMNSHAVDDVDHVRISDGDVVALSAAMPGLAGATLRRGGHLAPMRAAISQARTESISAGRQAGIIVLKLFNLVAKELGPGVLSGEICIRGRDLRYLADLNLIGSDTALDAAPDGWVRVLPETTS